MNSSARHRARLRVIGTLVLVVGIAGAGMLYWIRTRSADLEDDLSMVGYARAQRRQMSMLYGSSGLLLEDLMDDLKRPGTQAILIAGFSAVVASGCFFFARGVTDDRTN